MAHGPVHTTSRPNAGDARSASPPAPARVLCRRGAVRARFVAALLLGTCAAVPSHAQETKPQRIVSLDLCADQLLIELVPRDRIAAVTHLAADPSVSAIPEKARGLPVTHGAAEDVLKHDPDLVLAGQFGVSSTVSLLQRVGRNVVVVPLASDLDGVRNGIRVVASAIGEEARGRAAIADLDSRLARVAREAGHGPHPSALVYQVGGSTSLEGTLVHAAISAAGFANASGNYPRARGLQVPLEAILAHPPDLMVLASPPTAYRTVVADNLRHPALRALTSRIASLELPWRLWLCGTPHIADAIEALALARGKQPPMGATQ